MESVLHVLFQCSYAINVWNLAPLTLSFNPSTVASTWEGMDQLRKNPSLPPIGVGPGTLSAFIYWNLWISRNQLIFQKRSFSPEETALKAIREAREWTLAQNHHPQDNQMNRRITQDPPPTPDQPCMYTDAAWNPATRCAGLAWIIDDAGSSSIHSSTSTFVASPLIAETLALRNAMNSALQLGFTDLSIFSDSQILINLLISKDKNREIATLLSDIHLLSSLFNAIKFTFIPRQFNDRANHVAKQTLFHLNNVP